MLVMLFVNLILLIAIDNGALAKISNSSGFTGYYTKCNIPEDLKSGVQYRIGVLATDKIKNKTHLLVGGYVSKKHSNLMHYFWEKFDQSGNENWLWMGELKFKDGHLVEANETSGTANKIFNGSIKNGLNKVENFWEIYTEDCSATRNQKSKKIIKTIFNAERSRIMPDLSSIDGDIRHRIEATITGVILIMKRNKQEFKKMMEDEKKRDIILGGAQIIQAYLKLMNEEKGLYYDVMEANQREDHEFYLRNLKLLVGNLIYKLKQTSVHQINIFTDKLEKEIGADFVADLSAECLNEIGVFLKPNNQSKLEIIYGKSLTNVFSIDKMLN